MAEVSHGEDAEAEGDGQQQLLMDPRRLLESINVGVVVQDRNNVIVDANSVAPAILGLTRDQLLGRTPFDSEWGAVHEDGSPFPGEDHPITISVRTGEPCTDVLMGVDKPGHGRRWLSINSAPIVVDDRVVGGTATFADVTVRIAEHRALRTFSRLNHVLLSTTDEADLLQDMCTTIVEAGGYALVWIAIANHDEQRSVEIACSAGATDFLHHEVVSWSEYRPTGLGPTGTALRTGVTQVANDLNRQENYGPWRERARQFGLAAAVTIPLDLRPGQPTVLSIYSQDAGAFDGVAVELLAEMADQFSFGVAHLRYSARLRDALDGTLAAMSRLTETRDPYTAGHQHHVGDLGAAIAERLGLDPESVRGIRDAGEVHDLGKIAIPAEILSRPGKLDAAEFEIVKRHAQIGNDILRSSGLPWPLADVALQHHERLDGSGYPQGLHGDEICLPARIIAVADVVEAMSQHRPYRPALSIEVALAEVAAGAGTRFDADAVAACHAVFDDGYAFD
jgi:PAS domain S-box-containing protein